MKVIAVNGIKKSGKTTVCEKLISELRRRGYTVGSVKEIHMENFTIDPKPTANTRRHREAGSQLVTARGYDETDVLYQEMLPIDEILKLYDHDFVILEGVTDCNAPRIITAHNEQEIKERVDCRAVAVSGVFANEHEGEILDLPIFNAMSDIASLADFVVETAFEPLPNFDEECCGRCGGSCRELAGKIAHKTATREDCVLTNQSVQLSINGRSINMVPFVQNILKNAVMGVVSELQGFEKNSEINVIFKV